MHVKVYVLRDGKDEVAGTLALERGDVLPRPEDSVLLRGMLEEPVRDLETGEAVYPDEEPERFLKNLRYTYRSAYLRAGPVEA